MKRKRLTSWPLLLWPACVVILIFVLTACGAGASNSASSGSTSSNSGAVANGSGNSNGSSGSATGGSAQHAASSGSSQPASNAASNANPATSAGPQYLIKTLTVAMTMSDTRKTANEIQAWITSKDSRAVSAGTTYQQVGNNSYTISMTFAVESTLYPQVYDYLRDYNLHNNGQLNSFNETTQDVSNDYVDTQSRLKIYKGEQSRLLQFLQQAQSTGDVLNIEQKLTDVEQQIEQSEAHLNLLNEQVTFYNVTINIQPLVVATPPPPTPSVPGWSVAQTFQSAFAVVLAIGQALLTLLIWLLTLSIYIIPLGVIIWLVVRWRERRLPGLVAPVRPVQPNAPKSE